MEYVCQCKINLKIQANNKNYQKKFFLFFAYMLDMLNVYLTRSSCWSFKVTLIIDDDSPIFHCSRSPAPPPYRKSNGDT